MLRVWLKRFVNYENKAVDDYYYIFLQISNHFNLNGNYGGFFMQKF